VVVVIKSDISLRDLAVSITAANADSYSTVFALVGVLAMAVPLLRVRPRLLLGLFLAAVCFLPIWLGVNIISFFPAVALASIGALFLVIPTTRIRLTWVDLAVLFLFVGCLVPLAVGGSSKPSSFVVLSQWLPVFLLGRLAPERVPLKWLYGAIGVAFSVVSALAVLEFLLHWNPFVNFHSANDAYLVWSPIQERGGVPRAEGAFGHSIALGASIALAIPLMLASRFRSWIRFALVGLMMAATVFTFSRISMICAALSITLSVLFMSGISGRARSTAVGLFTAVALSVSPFLSVIFSSAGTEASNSADYRGNLLSLVPDISIIGRSPLGSVGPLGDLRFGRFTSIDSELILFGLTYGWLALALGLLLLMVSTGAVLVRKASAPTIAMVAQIPALATVALITQYSVWVWFVGGLAVAAQADAIGSPVVDAGLDPISTKPTIRNTHDGHLSGVRFVRSAQSDRVPSI